MFKLFITLLLASISVNTVAMMRPQPQFGRLPLLTIPKSTLHIHHLKGLYNGLADDFTHLSPAHGMALAHTHWLKNTYQVGIDGPPKQLISCPKSGLFHVLDNQIRPTRNKSNPCYSLNPELIGLISLNLHTKDLYDQNTRKKILEHWRQAHKKLTGDRASHAKIDEFFQNVLKSHDQTNTKEDTQLYPGFLPYALLSAHLCKTTETKSELLEYFATIDKKLPIFKNGKAHFAAQLNDVYAEADLAECTKIIDDSNNFSDRHQIQEYIRKYYEHILFYSIAQDFINIFPPEVIQSSYAFGNEGPVPDCMETAMRSICNALLANGKDTLFDLNMLPTNSTPQASFIDFYKKYPNFAKINTREVGQAWMNLVSGHLFLRYKQAKCDLNPRVSNLINLLNYLFTTKAKDVEEFGQLLSSKARKITFRVDNQTADNDAQITMEIGQQRLILQIMPGHARLDIKKMSKIDILNGSQLRLKLAATASNMQLESLLLGAYFQAHSFLGYTPNKLHRPLFCFLSTNIENPNSALEIVEKLFNLRTTIPEIDKMIVKIAQNIPDNDEHLCKRLVSLLMSSGGQTYQNLKKLLEKTFIAYHFLVAHFESKNLLNDQKIIDVCYRAIASDGYPDILLSVIGKYLAKYELYAQPEWKIFTDNQYVIWGMLEYSLNNAKVTEFAQLQKRCNEWCDLLTDSADNRAVKAYIKRSFSDIEWAIYMKSDDWDKIKICGQDTYFHSGHG